jgi:hypothetical protein
MVYKCFQIKGGKKLSCHDVKDALDLFFSKADSNLSRNNQNITHPTNCLLQEDGKPIKDSLLGPGPGHNVETGIWLYSQSEIFRK